MESVRIDKYLWAIRVFKTRTDAAEACNGNKVRINGTVAKASKAVRPGDTIEVRRASATLTYRVTGLAANRMGAALVPGFAENLTPAEEIEKMHPPRETIVLQRDRGAGRPTKKERRQLEDLMDSMDF